jgi:hypothetical protein
MQTLRCIAIESTQVEGGQGLGLNCGRHGSLRNGL